MAQVPVFVVVKGEQDIAKLSAAIDQANQKTTMAAASGFKLSSVLSGIGAGVGLAGVMGATQAISTLTGFIGDSVGAAMESERVNIRLGIALRDNIPAWRGSTEAVNAHIESLTRLAFDDEDLATSIGTLVAATKSEAEAFKLLDLAMNIARYRGIDLATATDMVAKAASGSTKALNAAIPATRGATSATEALERAMAATAGQAEAYADTMMGRTEAASVRFENAQERLGTSIMPLVTGALELAVGAVDALTTAASVALGPLGQMGSVTVDAAEAAENASDSGANWTNQVISYLPPALAATAQTVLLADATATASNAAINGTAAYYDLVPAITTAGNAAEAAAYKMRLLQMNADDATTAVKVNAAGSWTASSAQSALAVGLHQSSVGATKARTEISRFSSALSGGSAAVRDYTSVVAKAFDALRTRVTRAFDAIHEKNLRAIEDTRRLANEGLQGQIDAIEGEIAAAEAALEAKRNAIRLAELEAEVTKAQSAKDRERAQQELDDFKAQMALDKKRAEADAEVAKLKAQQDANDETAEKAKQAEEDRDKKQREQFESELAALETHLKAKQVKWDQANKDILALLAKYGVDFKSAGEKLGTKWADGYVKGVDKALGSIARAVAKLLGLDTVPKVTSAATKTTTAATTTPTTTTPTTGTGATAATQATGSTTTPTTTATATAPQGGPTTAGDTYVFNLRLDVGAFLGTDEDARKFAGAMWTWFNDETTRRLKVWPDNGTWKQVVDHVNDQ